MSSFGLLQLPTYNPEKVRVMHQGKIFAEGTPEEVRRDPQVQDVYLGWDT